MRNNELRPLGMARVMQARDGSIVVDRASLRRNDDFGADDFGDDDYDDDFGDDDYDDDFGDDDEEDDFGDDELGFLRRRRGGRRGNKRPTPRRRRRQAKKLQRQVKRGNMQETILAGSQTLAAAGAVTIQIRTQTDFYGDDVTFTGPAGEATVSSILFADRLVWSSPTPIPIEVFAATGFMRNLIQGSELNAGTDIIVNGALSGAGGGTLTAIVKGKKPTTATC